MKRTKVFYLCACSIFAALSAIISPINIYIGAVPINFVHVSLFLSAGLLGWKWGTVSQIVFIFLGLVGLPVFSGFEGGFGKLFGPTGGFLYGYLLCTFSVGLVIARFGSGMKSLVCALALGWVLTYIPGVMWYMYIMGVQSLTAALAAVWLPFIPGDILKSILSIVLIRRLWRLSLLNKNCYIM